MRFISPAAFAVGDIGVIHVRLLNIIRRMTLREKLPLRVIARRTRMSCNTIKKYLQYTKKERPEGPSEWSD